MIRSGLSLFALLSLLPLAAAAQMTGAATSSAGGGATSSAAPAGPTASGVAYGGAMSNSLPVTTDPNVLYPSAQDLRLNPGDLIDIRIYGQSNYNPVVRIGTDGTVLLPLIGLVHLQGLTIAQATELVQHDLEARGMFNQPQVMLRLVEGPNAVVTVLGVTHGVVPVVGQRRLLEVLAAAGGLPPEASHIVTINRPGQHQPIVVDLGANPAQSAAANIPIFAGDTIVTGNAGVVYVVGAFNKQGALPLVGTGHLTLMQAAALAGGPSWEGKFNDMRLIRDEGGRRTFVKLDLQKVLYGKAPDPILQANDIVFLPTSTMKAEIANGGAGIALALASTAVAAISLTR